MQLKVKNELFINLFIYFNNFYEKKYYKYKSASFYQGHTWSRQRLLKLIGISPISWSLDVVHLESWSMAHMSGLIILIHVLRLHMVNIICID